MAMASFAPRKLFGKPERVLVFILARASYGESALLELQPTSALLKAVSNVSKYPLVLHSQVGVSELSKR